MAVTKSFTSLIFRVRFRVETTALYSIPRSKAFQHHLWAIAEYATYPMNPVLREEVSWLA